MAREFLSNHAARMAALRAVHTVGRIVGATFGPRGGGVLSASGPAGSPAVTRHGALVLRNIELTDPAEKLVLQVLRRAATESARAMGDGTTTTALLAAGLIQAGVKWIAAGVEPGALGSVLRNASNRVGARLLVQSRRPQNSSELVRIGTAAAQGNEATGALLVKSLLWVGSDGDVTVEAAMRGGHMTCDIIDAFRLPVSHVAANFVHSPAAELRSVDVLLHDGALGADAASRAYAEAAVKAGRPLLVIARSLAPELAEHFVAAAKHDGQKVLVAHVDAPDEAAAELLQDLALFTGAALDVGAAGDRWPHDRGAFGSARIVRLEASELHIVDGQGRASSLRACVSALRSRIRAQDEPSRRAAYRRIGRLSGRSARLRLGAVTDSTAPDLVSSAGRALCALRAAYEDGVVPGGGIGLLRATNEVIQESPHNLGAQCLAEAVEGLIGRLATNAGAEARGVLEKVRAASGPVGFDASTGRLDDLDRAGVLDASKVVRTALDNAVYAACAILEGGGLGTERRGSTPLTHDAAPTPNTGSQT